MEEQVIVLNFTKIKENSIVLHTLSRSFGRRSFVVRVNAKTGMAWFLPLNIIDLNLAENQKTSLWAARPASARYALAGIRNNIYKNTMTLFMAEVLYRTIKDGAMEDGLFDWCERQILTLDALEADFSNYHIRFLLELCVALGFRPEASDLAPFCGENMDIIERFMDCGLAESMLIPMNGSLRNDVAHSIIRYLEYHTESTINIRSLQVLRELYG